MVRYAMRDHKKLEPERTRKVYTMTYGEKFERWLLYGEGEFPDVLAGLPEVEEVIAHE